MDEINQQRIKLNTLAKELFALTKECSSGSIFSDPHFMQQFIDMVHTMSWLVTKRFEEDEEMERYPSYEVPEVIHPTNVTHTERERLLRLVLYFLSYIAALTFLYLVTRT